MLAAMIRLALALALVASTVVPACSGPEGTLAVETGARSEALSAARLAELPQVDVAVGDKSYRGPKLADALRLAGVVGAGAVEAVGVDGYKQQLAAEVVGRDDVIVALGLPEGELRLVVPGSPGLSVKRLAALRAAPAAP
jgi:hypothetical protein